MNGRVITNLLNVRSQPHIRGHKIDTLPLNAIVNIVGFSNDWVEIKYNGGTAFIHGDYVERVQEVKRLKGKVKPALLNVRSRPNLSGDILGTLSQNTAVDIVAEMGDWLEIVFNNHPGFIHGNYVERIEAALPKIGYVNTSVLNIRDKPDVSGMKVGTLKREARIEIISQIGKWYEIRFGDASAYVHGDYIDFIQDGMPTRFFWQSEELKNIDLMPEARIVVEPAAPEVQRLAAKTWNSYGNFLKHLSHAIGIDIGCSVSVICVESGGGGFDRNHRMIIRFENHQFWKWWGKYHPEEFKQQFKFSADKIWQGHRFFDPAANKWISVHSSQNKEWEVFEAARQFDETAALKSISMGAPQIMGFNYKKIGYDTVQHMFNNFSREIQFQLFGLFDFFDNSMIQALKNYQFEKFAGYYNGTGQAQAYGGWIQEHYDAYEKIKVS